MNLYNLLKCPLAILFIAFSFCLKAQDDGPPAGEKPDTAWFRIRAPAGKVSHSLYRNIELLDQRPDTVALGLFPTSTYYDMLVRPAHQLALQLDSLLVRMTDSTAGNGVLLLQLRHFNIYSINTSFSNKIATYLQAVLYAQDGRRYRKLAFLDTKVRAGKAG